MSENKFNGLSLTARESSTTTPDELNKIALDWANEKSLAQPEHPPFFVFVLDVRKESQSFGITYSDHLKKLLQLEQNHYQFTGKTEEKENTMTPKEVETIVKKILEEQASKINIDPLLKRIDEMENAIKVLEKINNQEEEEPKIDNVDLEEEALLSDLFEKDQETL